MAHPAIEAGSGLRLRPSHDGDLATPRSFFADPGFNEQWGGRPLNDNEIMTKYTGARSPDVECFIVERGAVPIGFIQYCTANDGGEGGGIDLVLTPPTRGAGVGTAVVKALVRFLQEDRGWRRITVDPDVANPDGVRFWTNVGFAPEVRVDTEPEREPHWLMVWST